MLISRGGGRRSLLRQNDDTSIVNGHFNWRNRCAVGNPLEAVDDELVAILDIFRHQPGVARLLAGREGAGFHLVFRGHEFCGQFAIGVPARCALRNAETFFLADRQRGANIGAGKQKIIRVVEEGADGEGARRFAHRHVRHINLAVMLVFGAVFQRQVNAGLLRVAAKLTR